MTTLRRLLNTLLGLALVLSASTLTLASPAQAHSQLVSADPQDGADLSRPPTAITLTFNEEIAEQFAQIVLTGPDGAVELGELVVSGRVVTAPVATELDGGAYRTAYRVVSADGHPISGTLTFTVQEAASTASPSASDTPSASATPSTNSSASTPSQTSAASESPSATPSAAAGADPTEADPSGPSASTLALEIAVLAVVIGLIVWSTRRVRRRRPLP